MQKRNLTLFHFGISLFIMYSLYILNMCVVIMFLFKLSLSLTLHRMFLVTINWIYFWGQKVFSIFFIHTNEASWNLRDVTHTGFT